MLNNSHVLFQHCPVLSIQQREFLCCSAACKWWTLSTNLSICAFLEKNFHLPDRADSMSIMIIRFSYKVFSPPMSLRVLRYIAMTSISNFSSKSRAIRSVIPMCLARLNRRSQKSHKDGKAHFENNICHKNHIQLFLTCLDTLFHVIIHLFLITWQISTDYLAWR